MRIWRTTENEEDSILMKDALDGKLLRVLVSSCEVRSYSMDDDSNRKDESNPDNGRNIYPIQSANSFFGTTSSEGGNDGMQQSAKSGSGINSASRMTAITSLPNQPDSDILAKYDGKFREVLVSSCDVRADTMIQTCDGSSPDRNGQSNTANVGKANQVGSMDSGLGTHSSEGSKVGMQHSRKSGMPSMTAYFGLHDICSPKKGEYAFVLAVSGAVGPACWVVCQVVGLLCGWKRRVQRKGELSSFHGIQLKNIKYFLEGIDIYFENVGGKMLDIAGPPQYEKSRAYRGASGVEIKYFEEGRPTSGAKKEYVCIARLHSVVPDVAKVYRALEMLAGVVVQHPPLISAVKHHLCIRTIYESHLIEYDADKHLDVF
ncbi:hypothetical protein GIB67_028914 [Kingdonia uniflora]|uniref:Uncharacterized protein n=1 Tax=Kingdonia uniflora TaxID=39325 RepID=A0A7J7LSR0_9MAGN|nr:hypothetical protein GIB67_028914 [Kingdonia uniflora]